ncbi:hypothetical protein Bca52824_080108 [Brassica carinata]|uniref:Uncharacterized protein n=1 Tax=Brassica carinata TaxID=52824 RepID=A0A8X7Q494_BRACI|nr:hypothetical protein Bca52824_080108 [Brassica carinata]
MKEVVVSEATEIVVGDSVEDVVDRISGVDFLVVDSKRGEYVKALGLANTSTMGAVLVCKNATQKSIPGFKWHRVLRRGTCVAVTCAIGVFTRRERYLRYHTRVSQWWW